MVELHYRIANRFESYGPIDNLLDNLEQTNLLSIKFDKLSTDVHLLVSRLLLCPPLADPLSHPEYLRYIWLSCLPFDRQRLVAWNQIVYEFGVSPDLLGPDWLLPSPRAPAAAGIACLPPATQFQRVF